MSTTVYVIGLIVAVGMILFNIDDVIWDIVYLFSVKRHRKEERLPVAMLDDLPPKLLAIMIAAWHEENVLGQVIDQRTSRISPLFMVLSFLLVSTSGTGQTSPLMSNV